MGLTIVSLLEKVIYIDLYYKEEYDILAGAFVCDEKNVINRIQCADEQYRGRVGNIVNITFDGRLLHKIKSELLEIPLDSIFIVLIGSFDEDFFLLSLKKEIHKLNNINTCVSQFAQNYDLSSMYDNFKFCGYGEKEFIGERKVEERICRFCGKMMPEVLFSGNRSHAISEFLGNKRFFCLEECKACNSRFGSTIEQEFSKMLSPALTLFLVKGKKGYRKTKGKNFVIEPRIPNNGDEFYLKFEARENHSISEIDGYIQFDATSIKYIPQDVYKCLCKYVISLIDSKYLLCFQDTIKWINSPTRYIKLPKVAISSANPNRFPYMTICMRSSNNYNIPYCIATLTICGVMYAFIVPFCVKNRYSFTTMKKFIKFKEIVRSEFYTQKWEFRDFSYSTKRPCPGSFELKFNEDYYKSS